MEKNDEIKTVHSSTRSVNKKLLTVIGVVVILLIAGATYLVVAIVNQNANKTAKTAATKPALVAPAKVITSLKAANDTDKAAYDQHVAARAAFDEQPVKLVK
jgi:hypothetical protein